MDQFIIADLHPVLILDATLGSHPIVQTVLTPDEITAIFDTISYNKVLQIASIFIPTLTNKYRLTYPNH